MRLPTSLLLSAFALTTSAQLPRMPPPIQMQQSTTTASLRGIHSAGPGVAWASGTNGTVLRTEDAGFVWQSCAMPPGAEKLDFRGIWAWDEQTAVVMSSGPGDQSRLYKTADGCVTWKLLRTNNDKDGFWDAIAFSDKNNGYLLGDPINGAFVLLRTADGGASWFPVVADGLQIGRGKLGAFAASNSAMALAPYRHPNGMQAPWFGTGSSANTSPEQGPFVLRGAIASCTQLAQGLIRDTCPLQYDFLPIPAPLTQGSEASGVFSLGLREDARHFVIAVAVGGDYKKPNETTGTAAWCSNIQHFNASTTPPHGYRSAVAWDPDHKAWLTAGPNGTDYSRDDGHTWVPLENGNWNAISLPYLVGPAGRIGKLVSLPDTAKARTLTQARP